MIKSWSVILHRRDPGNSPFSVIHHYQRIQDSEHSNIMATGKVPHVIWEESMFKEGEFTNT
jgi:hypothetical protein